MEVVTRAIHQVRYGRVGSRLPGLWNFVRPIWRVAAIAATRGRGFEHLVNGLDRLRLSLEQMPNAAPLSWEPDQYRKVMSAISDGDHVIDVGAFWGLFSLGAARRVGATGRVVAVEPGPKQFSLLCLNAKANNFRIECVSDVCGEESGKFINFYSYPDGSMVDSAIPNPDQNVLTVERRTTTIDELVERFSLSPKVIKIDVEGFEDLVLRGARKTILQHRPIVFLEFHPEELMSRGSSVHEVLSILESLQLRCDIPLEPRSIPRGQLFEFSVSP